MTAKSFQTVQGVKVTNLSEIHEAYSVKDYGMYHLIKINVSAEHIKAMVEKFSALIRSPKSLQIEIPTKDEEEAKLRENDEDPHYQDVYYLDEITDEKFLKLFHKYEELFINDGFINFGLVSSNGIDEMIVKEYKIFYILTDDPSRFEKVLEESQMKKEEKVMTVWDTFTEETPGSISTIEVDHKDIYNLVEDLKKEGLYLATRAER